MGAQEDYQVVQGDCIESIAKKKGFFSDTIWRHERNSELRDQRKDPNTLMPGDVVFIPQLELKEESGETEARHRYRRRGVPARLRVKFTRPAKPTHDSESPQSSSSQDESVYEEPHPPAETERDEPISNAEFVLDIDGVSTTGTSDGEGMIDVPIPPDARKARITFFKGRDDEVSFEMDFGELAPADTVSGIRKRLHNLGYRCMPNGNDMDADLQDAIRRFQVDQELEVTGSPDRNTMDKVKEAHGS